MSRSDFSGVPVAIFAVLLAVPALAQKQTPRASDAPANDDSLPAITVQIAPPPISISSSLFGVSSPLGAQPSFGNPIFAEFVTEHQQSFVDGNRISRATRSSIYRDGQGRIRRESQLSLPGLPAGVTASNFVTIVDQHAGFGYVLDPQELVAHRYPLNGPAPAYVAHLSAQGSGGTLFAASSGNQTGAAQAPAQPSTQSHWRLHSFSHHPHSAAGQDGLPSGPGGPDMGFASAPTMRIDQPFLAAPNPVRTENLGEQNILGYTVRGTRVTTTLPAGQIGNDRPIDIVSEQWFCPELDLVMRSLHRDPWAGEYTTSVTHISRGEPPAALFVIPEQYKLIDASAEREHHVLDGHEAHPPAPSSW